MINVQRFEGARALRHQTLHRLGIVVWTPHLNLGEVEYSR